MRLETHIRAYLAALPTLLQHRASKGYKSMRFFRYVGKQKAIDAVCDVIAPRDRITVVGFGNWSNQGDGISRKCSGPMKEIRKRLSGRTNVLFKNVDERNTSCTCHGCFQKLENMEAASVKWRKAPDGSQPEDVSGASNARVKVVVKNVKVHKVLHCCNSVGSAPSVRCGATWNRDVNAAKNILLLLTMRANARLGGSAAYMDGGEGEAGSFLRARQKHSIPRGERVHSTDRCARKRAWTACRPALRGVCR